MKPIVICIVLVMVAYHATAQVDTANKNIAAKDSLHSSLNISMGKSYALPNGYYIHFPSDTVPDYKRMPLSFYSDTTYQKFPSSGFWNAAGSILVSILAEQTKHQYFTDPLNKFFLNR